MRAALLVLVLLVHNVNSYSYYSAEIVEGVNFARSIIAKDAKIANMNQLEYNSELEKAIYAQLTLTGGCPDSRIIYDDSKEIPVEIHINFNPKKKIDAQFTKKLVGGAGKTHVGYVETKCMVTGEEVHSVAFYKTKDSDLNGPPRSKCPSGRRATSDGLCALENSYARKVVDSNLLWEEFNYKPIPYVPYIKEQDEVPITGKDKKEEKWDMEIENLVKAILAPSTVTTPAPTKEEKESEEWFHKIS
ncbi:hypothetical protein B9Z55_026753 [Caenorhabditis nigoni]|uniref:Uncharacterized protein n=1 Tax=Caenorhabditis nigoni TaxID=1611254 RepID=A0A2G5SHL6_9PELO|nr:hypothetical protein B9Z55_026753 [Caenorhabditis nigoni]